MQHVMSGPKPRIVPWVGAATIACAVGCGSPGSPQGDSSSATGAGGTGPASLCESDPRALVYAVGLESKAQDGAVTVRFVDAQPAPPAKGNNIWTVEVLDAHGAPIDGATIVTTAYMPDHGHYSSIKPTSTPTGSPGTYTVTPVNLFMPGIWQVTLQVEPPQGAPDSVVFTFCIAG
jgi:YtkA-like